MTDSEKAGEQILSRLNELLNMIDQQGKKIDAITKRVEKLEGPGIVNQTVKNACKGNSSPISDECDDALRHPDNYKPRPGEATPKEDPGQANYRKSFWKKLE
jgi:hypothetical protein